MTTGSILKAGRSLEAPVATIRLRGEAQSAGATLAEQGVWFRQAELDALRDRLLEQGRREGEEQAHQRALEAARHQAESEAGAKLERELKTRDDSYAKEQAEKWRGLAMALAGQAKELRERLEAEVTEWTFIAITRLLGNPSQESVAAAVRQVLADAQLTGPLKVLLHSQDLAMLDAGRVSERQSWPVDLSFAADDRVKLGGCMLQTEVQTLDARLEVQLALLREALDAARHERVGEN